MNHSRKLANWFSDLGSAFNNVGDVVKDGATRSLLLPSEDYVRCLELLLTETTLLFRCSVSSNLPPTLLCKRCLACRKVPLV